MIRSQLNTYNGGDPIWGFVALVGSERFTGEAAVGLDPRVRLFAVDGRVYFAEREGDAPVGAQVLTADQLERAGVRVNGVTSLARMFHRDPTIDRDAVELSIAAATETLIESIANKAVGMPEVFPLRHHSSGMHHWLQNVVNTAPLVLPVAPVVDDVAEESIEASVDDDVAGATEVFEAPVTAQIPIVTFEEVAAWSPVEVFAPPAVATEEAVIEEAVVDEPVVEEPVVEEPVIEEAVVDEPVIEDAVVEDAVVEEPVAAAPVEPEPAHQPPPDLTVLPPWSIARTEPAAESFDEPVDEPVIEPLLDLDDAPEIEPLTVSIGGLMPLPMLGAFTTAEPAVVEPAVVDEPVVDEPVVEAPVAEEPVETPADDDHQAARPMVPLAGLTELLPPAPQTPVVPPPLPTLGSLAGLTSLTPPAPTPAPPAFANPTPHEAADHGHAEEPIVVPAPAPAPELPKLAATPISMHELVAQQEQEEQAEQSEAPSTFGGTNTLVAVDIWEMVDEILDDGADNEQQLVGSGASEKRGRSWLRSRKG
jgi:hypothetical protein